MTDQNPPLEEEEYEVVELEAENGQSDEFVIIDRVAIKGQNYAIMVLLQDVQNMEIMTEEECNEVYGDDSIFVLMREEEDAFIDLTESEYDEIKDELNKKLRELSYTD